MKTTSKIAGMFPIVFFVLANHACAEEEDFMGRFIHMVIDPVMEENTASCSGMSQETLIYIGLGVLALTAAVVLIACLCRKKPAPVRIPTQIHTRETVLYEEPAPPAPRGAMLRLTCMIEGTATRSKSIRYSQIKEAGNSIIVGRSSEAWFSIADNSVSRRHLEIFGQGGEFWVRDCGSTGGTTLNGAPLTEHSMQLKEKDHLVLASHVNIHIHCEE